MSRLIDADAFVRFLKDTVKKQEYENLKIDELLTVADVIEAIISELDGTSLDGFKNAPTIEPELKWIPFKTRPLTEEEKEDHPEWDCILDCKLPDDGQRILVSIDLRGYEEVQQDEFYSDDGSYLDSGYEIGTEAVAWMPLPEPYREEGD